MLTMTRSLAAELFRHARASAPAEMCGLLIAPVGHEFPLRFEPLTNVAADAGRFYETDPGEMLALYREMDRRGEDPIAIVHSHTATPAVPSGVDVATASQPGLRYVIVSLAPEEIRCWRIDAGTAEPEPVEVVSPDSP